MPENDTTTLNANVSGSEGPYALIQPALGPRSIETGDFLHACHQDFVHIQQDTDLVIGDHFVFHMHLEDDCEPVHPDLNRDRQRCEIKVAESSLHLQGRENDTFTYSWLFKIDGEMPVSKFFTHLFQLKSVGGDDDHPIVTITGEKVDGVDTLQVRWSPSRVDTILASHDWPSARGVWLEAYCQAKFAHDGFLKLTVKTCAMVPLYFAPTWRDSTCGGTESLFGPNGESIGGSTTRITFVPTPRPSVSLGFRSPGEHCPDTRETASPSSKQPHDPRVCTRPISAAVFPLLLRALRSAPCASSHCTGSALPCRAKYISSVP